MFEKMVTTAIPERVYALCKYIGLNNAMTSADLKAKMEPSFLKNGSDYFGSYRMAAEELELIKMEDNHISLAVDPEVISDIKKMRYYANGKLEKFVNGQFYKVTKAYFDMDQNIFHLNDTETEYGNTSVQAGNIADMGKIFTKIIGETVDAMAMRGWRFWVSFLGFGYMQDMFFIPNANVFLWDLIGHSDLEINKIYSASDFISALKPKGNIILNSSQEKVLNYGVSNGLRTLHDRGYIKLEHILDQQDIWNLSPMRAHSIKAEFTNVTILKEAEK